MSPGASGSHRPARGSPDKAPAGPISVLRAVPPEPRLRRPLRRPRALHATLQQREPVGIRPAGLTGMGGIGKTQLAVEYVYRYKDDYPDGIFWVNAAEPLAQGPRPGRQPVAARDSRNASGRAAPGRLRGAQAPARRPARLRQPRGPRPARPAGRRRSSPLTLGCRILFTTRQRELGRFQPSRSRSSPKSPPCSCSSGHDSRHAVRDDPRPPGTPRGRAICRLLGWLPLALELASAFLGEWPDISLADYRQRLQDEGLSPHPRSEVERPSSRSTSSRFTRPPSRPP